MLQGRLQSFALGDVTDDSYCSQAIGSLDRTQGDVGGELAAILAPDPEVTGGGAHRSRSGVGRVILATVSSVNRAQPFGYQELNSVSAQLSPCVAGHPMGLPVGVDELACGIDDHHSVGHPFQQLMVRQGPRLAFVAT